MCVCYDDAGVCDFRFPEVRRARKAYRCTECAAAISPGVQYVWHSSKWEGEVSSFRVCVDCEAWSKALCTAQYEACGCAGFLIGEMWDAVAEFAREHLGMSEASA